MRTQLWQTRSARIAASLALLTLAACGQGDPASQGSADLPTVAPVHPSVGNAAAEAGLGLAAMPSPSAMLQAGGQRRSVSYIYEDVVLSGDAYDQVLPNNRVNAAPPAAAFAAAAASSGSLADSAFAVYRFKVTDYTGNLVVRSFFDSAPAAGSAWIGAANWDTDRWDWTSWTSDAQDLGQSAPYKLSGSPPDDGTFLIVMLLSSGSATLDSIALGANIPPQAAFTSGPNPVEDGIAVNLDASASFDLDTAIMLYEWDWENDGTFDVTDSQPLSSHAFLAPGDFTVVLRVTAADGGSDTASTQVTVTPGSGNVPPTAALGATPQTGDAPLSVDFNAGASTDSDGVIVKYEWDFDGNGTFEQDGGAVATANHVYALPGIVNAAVRVTDNDAAMDTQSITITVTDPGPNNPPTASFEPDWYFGDAPLDVQVDASASSDPEGPIAKYEWDWDNNGAYEEDSGTSPTTNHSFAIAGFYPVKLRVTDGDGNTDIASVNIYADDSNLNFDDAEPNDTFDTAQALPGVGTKEWDARIGDGDADPEDEEDWYSFTLGPLHQVVITMDFIDAECDIDMKLYESDGTTELDSSTGVTDQEVMQYSSVAGGTYLVKVYKYSTDPLLAANYTLKLEGATGSVPVADLQSDVAAGQIPLTVNFDASASFDPGGGTITEWEWDLDGNGTYETSSTSSALETAVYYAVGTFDATVRVTNTAGFTDTAKITITTTGTYEEVEPNNDTATAQTLSFPLANFNGSLGPGGYDGSNEDWFKLIATNGQTLDVTMALHDNFADLDIRLYDTDGATILDSSTGTGDTETISYTFTADGTYFLKPYVFTANGAGGYKLDGTLN